MSFSYGAGANPQIDWPRMLIADTVDAGHIFEDSEIQAAYQINGQVFQSAQFYSGPAGQNLPVNPVNYLRCAALLLDCIASSKARLSSIQQLLDVKLDPQRATKALQDQAQEYRRMDDESGAFFIAEVCATEWAIRERFWAQVQRQSGGSIS